MINFNSIYFLLYLLLITGGSAAMAKNEYGITLLAISFTGFALTGLYEAVSSLSNHRKNSWQKIELCVLFIVFALIVLRINLIQFPYVEIVFTLSIILLALVYLTYLLKLRKGLGNKRLSYFLGSYYLAILVFLLALAINPLSGDIAQAINWLALVCVVTSIFLAVRVRSIVVRDKEVSLARFLGQTNNRSVLLLALFTLFGIYQVFVRSNFLPDIHSSKLPDGYYELVDKAADSGNESELKYQVYKEKMEAFMKNRGLK